MILFKVPPNRVSLFKKDGGALLKEVGEKGGVSLALEEDGTIAIEGDGGKEWVAEQVLKALCGGIKPLQAFKLFKDDYFIEVIDLMQAAHGSEKQVARFKSRIIGSGGKAKKKLQFLSGAFIAVNNDDVVIVGQFEDLKLAKEAVYRIIEGTEHNMVYAFMERASASRKRL